VGNLADLIYLTLKTSLAFALMRFWKNISFCLFFPHSGMLCHLLLASK